MHKKGLISPVFKYIFSMIAGAMFIMFFFMLAKTYMGVSESEDMARLMFSFDDTMDALSAAEYSVDNYDFRQVTQVAFSFDKLRIGEEAEKPTSKIIFAPLSFRTRELTIWSKRWEFPFPVTSFFYISSNKSFKYYLVSDGRSAANDFLWRLADDDEIPKQFGAAYYDIDDVEAGLDALKRSFGNVAGARFAIFVSGDTPDAQVINVKNELSSIENVDVVLVKPYKGGWDVGRVEFETSSHDLPYFGKAMLFGAIFSQGHIYYQYSMQEAFKYLAQVSDLYITKTGYLETASQYGTCPGYRQSGVHLANMVNAADDMAKETGEIDDYTIDELLSAKKLLEETNKQYGTECPNIY